MSNNRNDQESNIPWWAIVFGFMALPPLGFILLFMSLSGVRLSFFDRSVGTNRRYYGAGAYQQGQRKTPPAGAQSQGTYRKPGSTAGQGQTAYGQPGGTVGQGQTAYGRPGTSPGMGARNVYTPPKQAAAPKAAPNSRKERFLKRIKGGKFLTFLGGVTSFVFSIGLVSTIAEEGLSSVGAWFPVLGFLCAGLFTMTTGIGRSRRLHRPGLGPAGAHR